MKTLCPVYPHLLEQRAQTSYAHHGKGTEQTNPNLQIEAHQQSLERQPQTSELSLEADKCSESRNTKHTFIIVGRLNHTTHQAHK